MRESGSVKMRRRHPVVMGTHGGEHRTGDRRSSRGMLKLVPRDGQGGPHEDDGGDRGGDWEGGVRVWVL